MNAHHEPIPFTLPPTNADHKWERVFDTSDDALGCETFDDHAVYQLKERSLVVFRTKSTLPVGPGGPSPLQVEALRKASQRSGVPVERWQDDLRR